MNALESAVNELEALEAALRDIVQTQSDDWRKRLVDLRRAMAQWLGTFSTLLKEAEQHGRIDAASLAAIRDAFNAYRSVLALHQASFSAVAIAQDQAEYTASMDRVRHAHLELCRVVRGRAE